MNKEHEVYQTLLMMAKKMDKTGDKVKRIVYYPEKRDSELSCVTGLHVASALRQRSIDTVKYNGRLLAVRCGEKRGLNGALEVAFIELKVPNVLELTEKAIENGKRKNAIDTLLKLVKATVNDGGHSYSYYPSGSDIEYKDALDVLSLLKKEDYNLFTYGGQHFVVRSVESRDMAGGLVFASMQVAYLKTIVLIDSEQHTNETEDAKEPAAVM